MRRIVWICAALWLVVATHASAQARAPSAIQRATGIVNARAAGRPLDSILAVRILDSRGAELAGARVRWTSIRSGEGAVLRVLNAITDSAGLSRAAFTPGRSGDAQSVAADVPGVGRITFTVTVPAVRARIAPQHVGLWAGDDTVVSAVLEDVASTTLEGGQVAWTVKDTSVLRATRVDGTRARLTGARAGTTELYAYTSTGDVRTTARVTVRPGIRGRFVTLDGSTPPAMRVEVRSEGVRDSIAVAEGAFTARVVMDPDAPAFIHAAPLSEDAGVHHVVLRIDDHRDLQTLVVALVPTSWRITGGQHDGTVAPIDAVRAMERVGSGAAFWRLVPLSGKGPRKLLGWRESAFPLRLSFNRLGSRETIDARDSIAFWEIARQMEQDLDRTLFRPAELADSTAGPIVRVEVRPQAPEGHTFVSWEQSGDATDGVLLFRRSATLRDPHVVTHELVHLLGFGHAAAWPTIALPSGGGHRRLTAGDIAHIQAGLALRALQERAGARPGLPVPSLQPR